MKTKNDQLHSISFFEEKVFPYQPNKGQWKFEGLEAWKKAHQFVLLVYSVSSHFPTEEKFGLTSQLRRAAASIPANIAEGTGKKSMKDIIRFLTTSRGSVEEYKYYLILSRDQNYISAQEFEKLKNSIDEAGRLLNGLITSLEKKISNH